MCYQSQSDNSNIYFMRWLKPTIAISVCKHYIVKLVVPLSFFYTKIYLFLYLSKYNLNCTYFISLSIILSTLTQCNHFIISVRHQYCPKYPKNLQNGQYNKAQFYILSSTFLKNTGIGLMTDVVYITSTAGIDFLDRNTIESKSLSLWVWPNYVLLTTHIIFFFFGRRNNSLSNVKLHYLTNYTTYMWIL